MSFNWDDLRLLLALSRHGSLAATAKALELDHAVVSRRLAGLERTLGARLFIRNPDGMKLEASGELAAQTAQAIEHLCSELASRLAGSDARLEGSVRISTAESLAGFIHRQLPPLLGEHPLIRVEMVTSHAELDLARREADLAIRSAERNDDAHVSRKLGEIGWSLYAADSYLARAGIPKNPLDLQGFDLVGYDESARSNEGAAPGVRWLAANANGTRVVFRGNGPRSALAAVAAGLGVSLLPCFLTMGEPVRRLTRKVVTSVEAHVVVPRDHERTARVSVVIHALSELFVRERALLSGVAFDRSKTAPF